MEDKEIIKQFKLLNERYKQELENLKNDDNYNEDNKVQTVSVLREIITDIDYILSRQNGKNKTRE